MGSNPITRYLGIFSYCSDAKKISEKIENKQNERLRRVQSCILKQATAEAEAVLASLKSKFDLSRSLLGKSIKKESEAFDVKN